MIDAKHIEEIVGDLDEESMITELNGIMESNPDDAPAAMDACRAGMDEVGSRFQSGEYFLSDLIFAGEMMTEAVEVLKPGLLKNASGAGGKIIICTVKDDLHDIGKNIVKAILEANGFTVMDLGIDTPAEKVVQAVNDENIHIVALSGVLTLAIDGMDATIKALRENGADVKVIIGGAPINEVVCKRVGADAWAVNPQDDVNICNEWVKEGF